MKTIFALVKKHNLNQNLEKREFAKESVELLGRFVRAHGISVRLRKAQDIAVAAKLFDASSLRSFVGLTGYHRRFIKGFASLAAALYPETSKNRKVDWYTEMEVALGSSKLKLTSPSGLLLPEF